MSRGALIRYTSIGLLRYSFDPRSNEPKLHVDIDPGIAEMYRALVPKAVRLQRPKFAPHISVVRKEPVPRLDLWGVFEGREIEFEYESIIYNDETYYWLRCFSPALIEIRQGLGLPDLSDWARPPDLFDSFHCTLGNLKDR